MTRTFTQHLDPDIGPKRILALDGGGIRGALTLGYLERIEALLREKSGNQELLLCDYFDLIGGTSTGSIIAAGLATGMSVAQIRAHYMTLGGDIFGDKHDWWNPLETFNYLRGRFDHYKLEASLREVFGDITLGSELIRTGLCIVAKRADTNSTWPLNNHPKSKFFKGKLGNNANIPLWQAVRASSAAPTYFVPQMIDIGNGQRAAFVDGGVSMANNPALTLLMVATLKGFPFRWELGADKLCVVSVGTGYSVFRKQVGDIEEANLLSWAVHVPEMLMQDANWHNQIMLQWLSESPTAKVIDSEMGNLSGDLVAGKPMISYLRYNLALTQQELKTLGLRKKITPELIDNLADMSRSENRELLFTIGQKAAQKEVLLEHFSI